MDNYPNEFIQRYGNDPRYSNKVRLLGEKINPSFYPAVQDIDIAKYLYNNKKYNKAINITNMSPDVYLKQSYNTWAPKYKNILDGAEPFEEWYDRIKRETIKRDLVKKINSGQKLDMPELRYDEYGRGVSQEGNHRAMAAKLLGKEEIPVAITTYTGKKGVKEAIKKNMLKALRFGGKVLMSAPLADFSVGVDYYPQLDLIMEKDPKQYSKKYNKYMNITPGQPGYMDEQGYLNY